jgi:hypothetical protein
MKTMRQLITRAARLATIHGGAGMRVLPAEMVADGLESALGMYSGFIGNGLFGPITDVLIEEAYEAGENERIVNSTTDDLDITLPITITECGVDRSPEDRAFVIISGVDPLFYVYDADVADWVEIGGLTLDSDAPLSGRFATGLSALLAVHMLSEYGIEPSAILADMARTAHGALRLKKPRIVSVQTPLLRGVGRTVF